LSSPATFMTSSEGVRIGPFPGRLRSRASGSADRSFKCANSRSVCQLVVESPPPSHPWGSPKRAPLRARRVAPMCRQGTLAIASDQYSMTLSGTPYLPDGCSPNGAGAGDMRYAGSNRSSSRGSTQTIHRVTPRRTSSGPLDRPPHELRRAHFRRQVRPESAVRTRIGERLERVLIDPD
jgi:hypothetical protein